MLFAWVTALIGIRMSGNYSTNCVYALAFAYRLTRSDGWMLIGEGKTLLTSIFDDAVMNSTAPASAGSRPESSRPGWRAGATIRI